MTGRSARRYGHVSPYSPEDTWRITLPLRTRHQAPLSFISHQSNIHAKIEFPTENENRPLCLILLLKSISHDCWRHSTWQSHCFEMPLLGPSVKCGNAWRACAPMHWFYLGQVFYFVTGSTCMALIQQRPFGAPPLLG